MPGRGWAIVRGVLPGGFQKIPGGLQSIEVRTKGAAAICSGPLPCSASVQYPDTKIQVGGKGYPEKIGDLQPCRQRIYLAEGEDHPQD